MTRPGATQPRLARATLSLVSLAGGVSLAAIPASALSISTHTFDKVEQGYVSVVITAATFISQLVFAAIVESRLSSARTERRVTFPRWLAALAILASIAVLFASTNSLVVCVALPILLSALEVGRGVSVAEHLDRREAVAALLVGVGALTGVASAFLGNNWGFVPLVLGIAGAAVVRVLPVEHVASRPEPAVVGWVLTDVAITGIIYPVLNTLVLLFIGPAQSVLFAAISTVSGLLSIPLNFMRLRLLKAHSPLDIWLSAAAVLVATGVIAVLQFTGILGNLFHGPWTIAATVLPLAIACVWRATSLATTLPFAALRRGGHVRLLAVMRGACAVLTFGAGLAVVGRHNLTMIFIVMLAGEAVQATIYELARRRVVARDSVSS